MQNRRPSPDGQMFLTSPPIQGGHAKIYQAPSNALKKLDEMRSGIQPRICVTRRQGGIGDVLMTLPTVKAIAQKYGTRVVYGTDFTYLDGALEAVVQHLPYISETVSFRDIFEEDFHAIVDLTCPCVAHEKPRAIPINRIDLFARHAGVVLEDHSMDYVVTEEESRAAQRYLESLYWDRDPVVLVQACSTNPHRDCPVSVLKQVLDGLVTAKPNVKILMMTHDSDNLKTNWNLRNMVILKDKKVRELTAIMDKCKLVICPDSAILHLASALHKPTLTFFGPTDPRARVNYHPEAVAVWPARKYQRYPVWYEDPKDGWLCWKIIDVKLSIETSLALLESRPIPENKDLIQFPSLSIPSSLANFGPVIV